MEVRPPLASAGRVELPGVDRVREAEEPRELSISRLGGLAEVDGVGEGLQRRHRLGGDLGDPQGGSRLQLEDRDSCAVEQMQRLRDVLELHGLVADVEDDAEVPADRPGHLAGRQPRQVGQARRPCRGVHVLVEVADRLLGGLQEAVGLRLQGQLDAASGASFKVDEVGDDAQQVLREEVDVLTRRDLRAERQRGSLDRRVHRVRRDLRQDVRHLAGVCHAVVGRPVRLVDLLHHHPPLERAIGERVHRIDVHVVLVQPAPKAGPLLGVGRQRGGGGTRDAKRQSVGPLGADA